MRSDIRSVSLTQIRIPWQASFGTKKRSTGLWLCRPNEWDRAKTFYNIIRKINPDAVQGSNWDPDSIMHYPFEARLIKEPSRYQTGLQPQGGLSS